MGARDFLGNGFSFPPAIDAATGRFKMVSEEEDIRQAIYIMLMTRKGEYAMQPAFGSNLHHYVFELPDETFINLVCDDIVNTLARWEPRVIDVLVNVDTQDYISGKIIFNISYVVRATNNPNNLVFPYYLYEGVGGQ